MKFVFNGKMMVAAGYIGEKAKEGSPVDYLNRFSDWVVQGEYNFFVKPIINLVGDLGMWFVENIPDIMGYCTIIAGIWCVIGAMSGKGGMMKPLGYLTGGLILAVCILGGV